MEPINALAVKAYDKICTLCEKIAKTEQKQAAFKVETEKHNDITYFKNKLGV